MVTEQTKQFTNMQYNIILRKILIATLLLLSGIGFSQTTTRQSSGSSMAISYQTYFITNLSDTSTLISPKRNESLYVSSTAKFYKRTSYWALQATISTGSGTVSSVSVVSANGLAGTVATATTTPAITLSTTITGILKGNGTAISAATPSTDYTIPADLSVYLTTSTAASTYMPLTGAAFTTTTGIGHELTSSTLTSGSLFKLTGTSTASLTGAKMFEISSSGANSNSSVTKYGVYSSVTNTGTTSTNVAGYFNASGGSTANYAVDAVGAIRQTFNGVAIFDVSTEDGTFHGISIRSNGTESAGIKTNTTGEVRMGGLSSSGYFPTFYSNGVEVMRLTTAKNIIANVAVSTGTGSTAGFQFNANSLTTGNGIDASTSSLTTGMLAQFASTSTALSGTSSCVQKIMSTGANANSGVTATGLNISVANTNATSGTNVAVKLSASGATTDNVALNVTAGRSIFAGRMQTGKGATVASTGDLVLGADGNVFHISGTTTINAITTTLWQAGSQIILIFDSTPTVKNNTAGGANTAVMLLAGGVDFSATANDVLKLVYDGTSWYEIARSIN